MERTIADLPSRDFFLKTLDSPGPARVQDLDEDGDVVKPAPKPERQVNNDTPAATIVTANKP
jgi:hypothetical protein